MGLRGRKSSMGNKRTIMFLMALFFFFFCSTASLFPQSQTFPNSVHFQEKNKGIDEYNSSSDGSTSIAHRSALARGAGGRTNGGQSGGSAANGNGGGGSRTPGGAAVIPIYGAAGAAGAARNHGNSHSAGTCYRTGLPALIATILVSLFMCI